jgi:membrane-bound lytic murein transglycosylase D
MRRWRTPLAAACLAALAACQAPVRPDVPAPEPVPEPPVEATPAEALPATPAAEAPATPPGPAALPELPAPANLPPMGHGQVVFERIRRNLSPGACEAGATGARWRKRFAGHPTVFARHLEEMLPLLDFVSIEVERSGLPGEFVFIPLVESGYRPDAIGVGGPTGMWQMIGSTARNHGIHIKPGYDGRLSPVESTRAALSYLKTLQGMFGGWQAIVMAYNAGEGRLQSAFRRARSREVSAAMRRPHGLANVTYDYVAKLQALSCLVAEPERAGVDLPTGARFVPVVPVLAPDSIASLDELARQHGVATAELRRLNPGYKGGRIVAGVPRLVLTPTLGRQAEPDEGHPGLDDRALAIADAAGDAPAPTDAGYHEVRPGDSLWKIARLHGLSVEQLRRYNRLAVGQAVRPGQRLKLAP